MSLPTGTSQAEEIRLRKSCRGCNQPLYGSGQDEHFPVAGIGVMHLQCAEKHCSVQGISLHDAVPICKHWRLKGHCIYQEKCRNRHPPDARKGSETIAAQQSSTKQDRAAAWRVHNAAMQQGQQKAPSSKEQPLWRPCDGQQKFQSGKPQDPQSATAVQHTFRESTRSSLAQGFTRGAPKLPSANIASPSCEATDPSVNEDPSDCVSGPAGLSSAPARKKLSYARLGPAAIAGKATEGSTAAGADTKQLWDATSCDVDSEGLKRFKIRNRFRAGVFRRFLIDTFGREILAQGSGVLDIGGGRGDLSFELLNLNNIRATIVDPRPGSLGKQAKWLKTGFFHRNSVYQAYVDRPLSDFAIKDPEMPQSVRVVLNTELCAALVVHGTPDADDTRMLVLLEQAYIEALDDRWIHRGAHHKDMSPSSIEPAHNGKPHLQQDTESRSGQGTAIIMSMLGVAAEPGSADRGRHSSTQHPPDIGSNAALCARNGHAEEHDSRAEVVTDIQSSKQKKPEVDLQSGSSSGGRYAQRHESSAATATMSLSEVDGRSHGLAEADVAGVCSLFQDASVLVGMHPDQATEHILSMAQQLQKPFAVVPCCVHAKEAPHRRLLNGGPVRSHKDLIDYIVSKDPQAIEVAQLPFEGRNTVVYCRQWSLT